MTPRPASMSSISFQVKYHYKESMQESKFVPQICTCSTRKKCAGIEWRDPKPKMWLLLAAKTLPYPIVTTSCSLPVEWIWVRIFCKSSAQWLYRVVTGLSIARYARKIQRNPRRQRSQCHKTVHEAIVLLETTHKVWLHLSHMLLKLCWLRRVRYWQHSKVMLTSSSHMVKFRRKSCYEEVIIPYAQWNRKLKSWKEATKLITTSLTCLEVWSRNQMVDSVQQMTLSKSSRKMCCLIAHKPTLQHRLSQAWRLQMPTSVRLDWLTIKMESDPCPDVTTRPFSSQTINTCWFMLAKTTVHSHILLQTKMQRHLFRIIISITRSRAPV